MKDVVGSPGTWSGLALRVSECACAGASLAALVIAFRTQYFIVFYASTVTTCVQLLRGLTLVCLDIYCLKTQVEMQNRPLAIALVLVDWAIAIVSLATTSAAAGLIIFFKTDIQLCSTWQALGCGQYQLSVILGCMAWSFRAASAIAIFRLFALV